MAKKKTKKKVDPTIALLENINTEIDTFRDNSEKFMEGNKAAGARSRKNSLNLTKQFKEWRKLTVG